MKRMKRALALILSLLLVFNMTTFAASEKPELSAKMYWSADFENGAWNDVEAADAGVVFNVSNFEPGSEVIRYLKVENTGKKALSYALSIVSDSEVGELANVIDVYYKSDISANADVSEMVPEGTLAEVINGNILSEGNILPGTLVDDGFYTGSTVVAIGLKMKADASSEYMNKTVSDFSINLTVRECAYDKYPSVDKFALAFPNTDKYIYRVGNANAVKLSSLFKALEDADIGNVTVQVEKLDAATDVSAVYTPATVWSAGTIQFSGTGPVKVTIDDDDFANELSLNLEVINAINLTSKASVTSKDAVLLNDATFDTFAVSNGYTLYGNGFTLTAPDDVLYSDWGNAFVTLTNGTLDNVRIVCPNFPYQVLYQGNMRDAENKAYNNNSSDFFYNVRSAVKMTGSSKITNSYVSGGRVAVHATSGDPVIENSTIYGGAAANIHVVSPKSLLLRDTTLIQEPIQATVHDTSKTIMGLSVFLDADASGNSAPITLEGDFVQYAWANEEYKQYVPSSAKDFVSKVLSEEDFKHQVTYKDGVTRDSLNLGFVSIPNEVSAAGVNVPSVTDNRTKKNLIPYDGVKISVVAGVYSYVNTNGLDPSFAIFPVYEAEKSSNIPGTLSFSESGNGISYVNTFDDDEGHRATLTVDLDTVDSYNFSFDKLNVKKYGRNLSYVVKDSNGNTIDKTIDIELADSGVKDYILEVTDNILYGPDGQLVSGSSSTYTYKFSLVAKKSSINPPEAIEKNLTVDSPLMVVKSKNSDWSCAVPASLSGIKIKYYSTTAKDYKEINLGDIVPTKKGKQNGVNNFWEHDGGDYSFKITSGYIHEGKQVYGMPVVVDNGGNKLYFTISSTNGYVSTSTSARTCTLTYEFADNNGNTLTFSKTWQVNYADYKETQYSYSDFVNGTLKTAGGGCVTGDTLVTLADGSAKRISQITADDVLLVWDFYNGEYAAAPSAIISNHGEVAGNVITLRFEDDTEVKVVDIHQFFDADENVFVSIDAENVADYVGHSFVKRDGKGYKTVKLKDYSVANIKTDSYGIVSAYHYNILVEDMFSADYPYSVYDLMTYFEVGENMVYDKEKMDADIENYGIYTYEEFAEYMTREQFDAMNIQYMKIPVSKGYYTYEGIIVLIERWLAGYDDIAPMQDYSVAYLALDTPIISITASGNSITAGNYAVTVSGEGVEAITDGYEIKTAECDVVITANGTATTGYAKIAVGEDVYYTNQIANGESFILTMKNAIGKVVKVESFWGNSANYGIAQDTLIADGKVIEYTYTVAIEATNATETEDGYAVNADEATFAITANGSATPGYAKISVNGDDYYTTAIAKGETFTFTVKNANGKVVAIETFYGEPTAENLLANGSTIGYVAEVSTENATLGENGKYVINADEATITVAASGTSTGYAKITVGSDVYYTNQIAAGESFTLNLKNAKGEDVAVETIWSNSANDGIAQDTLIADGKVIEYTYTVAIEATNATETEDGYAVNADEATFAITANGSATPGYAKISVNGDDYYTTAIAKGETFTFTVKNANGKVVAIETFYGEPTAENLLANDSTIGYIAEVSATNATLGENGKYVVNADEATIKVTASGTSTGYAKITVGSDVYYTNQIAAGESFTLNLKNAKGEDVAVETIWSNSANDGIAQDTLIADGKVIEYTYTVAIEATNATETEDGYAVNADEATFAITANGSATPGYAKISVNGDDYYTTAVAKGETFTFTVKNANGKVVVIETFYGEPTAENLLANGSTIGYVAEVAAENATLNENGKYVVNADEATIKVTASGTSTGYAKITVGSDVYYTNQIAAGGSFTLNLKNAKGEEVAVETIWSNSANDGIAQDTLIADGKVIEYTYTVAIEATNATETEDGYAVNADEATFAITANGSATPGYAKISVNGDDYYTTAIAKGETFTFTVKNANGKVVVIETFYGEPTAENLLANGSTIGYIAEVSAINAIFGENGKYVVNADEATIKVTASGTSTGYAKITVGSDVYYTNQIAAGEVFVLNIKNALGKTFEVETFWAVSFNDGIAQDTLVESGRVIEYPVEVTVRKNGDTFTVSTNATLNGEKVYIAAYDAYNRMIAVISGDYVAEGTELVLAAEGAFYYKVFIWDASAKPVIGDVKIALIPETKLVVMDEADILATGKEIDCGMTFETIDDYSEAVKSPYENWIADYEIVFDADTTAVLSGSYGNYDWVDLAEYTFAANTPVKILETAQLGKFTYSDIALLVQKFSCGVKIVESTENVGIVLSLTFTNPETGAKVVAAEQEIVL